MAIIPIQDSDPLLNNLQANILKGHGRNFAHHLFLQLDAGKAGLAKNWISSFANTVITSARQQQEKTLAFRSGTITDGGSIITLSLSASCYNKLGLQASKPRSNSFEKGMQGSAQLLADNADEWDEPFRSVLDMLIIVADDKSKTAKAVADDILKQVSSFSKLVLNQRGNVLKTKSGMGIEHFGYADGISQPLYLADDINRQASINEWNDATDRDLLLVADNTDLTDSFGSFLVFRKLEQNVKRFKEAENKLPVVKDVNGNKNKELPGAMLVGRFENSLPVVKTSTGIQTNPPNITNDFNYSDDTVASKCPFHSHIRLMNPRNGDVQAGDVSAQRITRRGIPYDDVNRIPEERINTVSDDLLQSNEPVAGVGLLFMCYQKSIETQFEILQAHWANEGNIAGHFVDGQDSLIGQGSNPDKTLPVQWGAPAQTQPFSFNNFVRMKGGEYFFTPGIAFLKGIGSSIATL